MDNEPRCTGGYRTAGRGSRVNGANAAAQSTPAVGRGELAVSGRNNLLWPDFTWRYRMLTRNFDPAAYHFSRINPNHPAQKFAFQRASQPAEVSL